MHTKLTVRQITTLITALVVAGGCLWAQGDTPIIVGDGSLFIRSEIPWTRFRNGGARNRMHPDNKTLSRVEIVMPNHNQTLACGNQKCVIAIRYGSTDITISSGNNGKGLSIDTDFATFHRDTDEKRLAHNDEHQKISHVVVTRGNQKLFDANAKGGTQITIHYE